MDDSPMFLEGHGFKSLVLTKVVDDMKSIVREHHFLSTSRLNQQSKEQLRLYLVLYNPRDPAPTIIEQKIGSGVVSIQFES